MTFGENRNMLGTNYSWAKLILAKELDLSYATINRWEKGKFEPSIKAKNYYMNLVKNRIRFEE